VRIAYKRDIDDVRESPALDIIHLLKQRGARVTYSDPHVPSIRIEGGEELHAEPIEPAAGTADGVVIITEHTSFDYQTIAERARLIVDTRNALKHFNNASIVRL
jgi:UDP-N-acetyl-D-glucosamine dehydrogenase